MAFIYQRRVAFADTDAAGRVHFSRLLCYVEEAEHTLLTENNIPVLGSGGWPRVCVECNYFSPLGPGDAFEVILIPEKVGRTSVSWSFNILSEGQDVAKGSIKAVRVDADGKPSELPNDWKNRLAKI